MRAFLSVRVISAVRSANENRGVSLGRIVEIQTCVWRERFRSLNCRGCERFRLTCIKCGLAGKAGGADKERRGCQSQKVAELTPRDLRFLIALVRKLRLK